MGPEKVPEMYKSKTMFLGYVLESISLPYSCFLVSRPLKADLSLHQLLCVILNKSQIIQLVHEAVLHFNHV